MPAESKPPEQTGEPVTQLCLACGICCAGLLHSRGKLQPEEVATAKRIGLDVIDVQKPAFRLPCSRFTDCCSVYDERPRACRRFRCALLRRVEEGELSVAEGLGVVREARRLIAEAEAVTGPSDLVTLHRSNVHAPKSDRPALEKLRLTALAIYLDKHFVLSRDGYFYSTRTIGAEENE